jgi:hypothetical protein
MAHSTFRSDPLAAAQEWAAYKRGEMSAETFYARLAQRACPPPTTPRNWRRAVYQAAARGRLGIADIVSLERNKGGTEDV